MLIGFSTVVETLNYNNVDTLLLTAPPYVVAVIATWLNAWHADRTGERFYHIAGPLCVAVFSFILAAATTTIGPRYLAMMLMVGAVYSAFVVALAWISNSMPRPPAKRAAALAFVNAVSNCSSIYASYMYEDSMSKLFPLLPPVIELTWLLEPRYVIAMSVNCAMAVIAILMALLMKIILTRLNKKLDQGIFVEGAVNSCNTEAGEKGFRFRT